MATTAATGALRTRISTIFRAAAQAKELVRPDAFATVTCTLNNTHVCVSKHSGEVVSKVSAGMLGFKGPQRSTPQAALAAGKAAAEKAREAGYKVLRVRVKGPTKCRGAAIRGIVQAEVKVSHLEDVTGFPTNGCRPRKERRL